MCRMNQKRAQGDPEQKVEHMTQFQIDLPRLFIKVNNIKVLTSNPRKFVGTHSENFQFLSGTCLLCCLRCF